jgi:ABC-type branched-subunit amino acid transport system substrate-binding protein
MTPFLQFRLWLKESPIVERRAAVGAGLLAAALLAWALAPVGGGTRDKTLAAGATAANVHTLDGGGAPVAATADTGAAGAASPASGAAAVTGGVANTTSGRSTSGAGSTSGGAAKIVLRATDRGVTADSIKVGFSIISLGGLNLAGYASGTRDDMTAVVDALVDNANKEGGVLGRKIVADKKYVDLLRADAQRRACLDFVDTDGVFTILDSFAMLYSAAKSCVTTEKQTPLITGNPGSADSVRKGAPFQISPQNDDNRKVRDMVLGARDIGFFKPANGFKKLGLMTDNCEPYAMDGPGGLKATLREIGFKDSDWSEFRSDCDLTSQERSGQPAVLQHSTAGVSHVLIATQGGFSGKYIDAANQQQYHPKYFAGDYLYTTVDGIADAFNPDQFDHTKGISVFRTGELSIGRPLSPLGQKCDKIMRDHGLPGVDGNFTKNFEMLMLCENLELFLHTARKAGPDLTRKLFGQTVQTMGDFAPAFEGSAKFSPGKFTGGDSVKYIEWHRECTCWKQISEFKPGY